jgi:anti-anti-sigma factor
MPRELRNLDVRSDLRDASLSVTVGGDLDMPATFKLESELDRLLAAHDVRNLVLDLAAVRFVDSAGLGALLAIRERAKELGIDMLIADASDPVRRLLHLTGTGDALAPERPPA